MEDFTLVLSHVHGARFGSESGLESGSSMF